MGQGRDQLHPVAVIVKGTENQEVYVTFSPQFERISLETKKRLPEYVSRKPANLKLRSQYSIRFYDWAKKYVEAKPRPFPWRNFAGCSALSRSRMRKEA